MPKKKKLVPEPETLQQTTLAASAISQVSSIVSFLTTPEPFPPKPMSGRLTTPYAANITASIALPERPKSEPTVCKKFNSLVQPASTFLKVTSFFTWAFTPAPETKKSEPLVVLPIKIREPSEKDMDVRMKKLVLETMKQKDPKKMEDIYIQQIDLVEYEIMEHAQRRVDLYFYLLVAVYKLDANVVKVFTQKQHGSGTEEKGTNACHDSFFPNILLQYPQSRLSYLWSAFVTQWNFSGTHFEDANNMTTELPAIVNYFDTHMEFANPGHRSRPSKYVNKLLEDLNHVSRGEKTPIDAMNSFLTTMKLFFATFEKKLDDAEKMENEENSEDEKFENDDKFLDRDEKKLKLFNSMHRAMRKIYELQKTGTLRAQEDDSHCIDHHYICSLLRVPPDQILATRQNPSLLLNYYCPIIQKEIFTTKSVIGADRKINKPKIG